MLSRLPETPLVSVVIPAYNGARFLAGAIDSALGQTYPRIEVVVVDDGSTDDTAAIAAGYGDRIVYIHQANAGTAAARNTGIRHAAGELIALLDQDDRWLPNRLARQVPLFDEDQNVGMVHAGGRVIDAASGAVTSEYLPAPELDVHALMTWCRVGCATTVMRRDVLDEIGGFDPALPGADDWDLWIRIAARYRVLGCREVLVEILEHPGNQGKRLDRMHRIASAVIEKHRGTHPECRLCEKASASAAARLREDYYVKCSAAAREALSRQHLGAAMLLRAKAFLRHPAAAARLPRRLVARLLTGGAA